MMGKKDSAERTQMEIASLEDLVPRNHLVRKLEDAIDLSFIYDEVKGLYSDFGRESIDPVVLIKIAMIQYIFGIPSMRKTIREIEVNFAYRWYLGQHHRGHRRVHAAGQGQEHPSVSDLFPHCGNGGIFIVAHGPIAQEIGRAHV